jgi:hypothetical protein
MRPHSQKVKVTWNAKNPIITGHDPRYGIFSNALGTLYPVHENIHVAWDKI